MGQILGWLIGDGWLRDQDKNCRIGFTFSQEDRPILDYLKPIINNFYGHDIKEVLRENDVYHLSYHSKFFVEFFKNLGVKACKSEDKEVPQTIFTATEETIIGFLQGLFTADGTVRDNPKTNSSWIALTSKSRLLLKQTQLLLLNLGIKSKIYDRSRKAREGLFPYVSKDGEHKTYTCDGILFELGIFSESRERFRALVGFLNENKTRKLDNIKFNRFYSQSYEERIVSIEDIGEKEVFNLTEPSTHSMIVNGIVTRQCGEQPLLPYESCCLGSINLSKMVKENKDKYEIDWDKLSKTARTGVHFLDNLIDINKFPLKQIEENTKRNRKIGLGVMGWASLLFLLEIPYNSEEAVSLAKELMSFILDEARKESISLAKERGTFPSFKQSTYAKLNPPLALRNATLTTIAPTGTISIIAGPCSSGVEPVFAISYYRNVMDQDKLIEVDSIFEQVAKRRGFYSKELMQKVAEANSISEIDEIPLDVRNIFVTAHDTSPTWHIRMQAAFQKYTDNAVSKTVNFPNQASEDDVREVYMLANKLGCKGITIYRDGSRDEQVLNIDKPKEQEELTSESPKKKIMPKIRPEVVCGTTTKFATGCGNLYVTINCDENGKPFEVFTQMGKAGGCAASQLEAIGRLVSLSLRSNLDVKSIIEQLRGIRCPSPSWEKGVRIFSCADAISRVIERRLLESTDETVVETEVSRDDILISEERLIKKVLRSKNIVGVCPDCGSALRHEEGCIKCYACGYSKC